MNCFVYFFFILTANLETDLMAVIEEKMQINILNDVLQLGYIQEAIRHQREFTDQDHHLVHLKDIEVR